MNRRDFLRSRQLAETAGQVLGALQTLEASGAKPRQSEGVALLRASRQAMATTFEIVLPCGLPFALEASRDALDLIDRLEAQLTVYRETSEVSDLNRRAFHEPVPVEEDLFQLLSLADRLTRETDGAFDITAGALIKTWGFFRRAGRVPTELERQEALDRTGMRHVTLDAEAGTVRFAVPGLEINLGSIGKGYALDRVAAYWREHWNVPAALLHGGHSSVYAIGSEPGERDGWAVGVRHPWDPEKRLAVLRLRDRGLGTSAVTYQHLEHEGRKLGHLLDPRTGWPAEQLASASVVAPTAAEADALATAFFVLGIEPAREYCRSHPAIGAVLLPNEPDARPLTFGLSPHDFA